MADDIRVSEVRANRDGSSRRSEQREKIPKEIVIPEDFRGVLQINVQTQRETESTTQNQASNVAVTTLQNQVTQVNTGVQNLQAMMNELTAGQRVLQQQVQMLMLLLGTPAGSPEAAAERQRMLNDMAAALRQRR
jgi:hypothetical protein